jgi:ABC-type glycerol-3-phosphate transport system substrate-binding protein
VLEQDGDGNTTRWGGTLRGGIWWGWVYHIRAHGGQVRDEETWLECKLGEPEAVEALTWLKKANWDDPNCFARGDQISATGLPNQSMGGLPGGIVCMAELSTEGIGAMQQAAQEGLDWEWGQTHYPTGPVQRSAQGLPDVRSQYSGTVERGTMEAAWEWLKFTCAEEWFQEQGITRTCARLPGLLSVVERWPTILREMKPGLEDINIETIIEAIDMDYLSGSPNFRYHREAQELLDPAFEAILVTGDEDPEYIIEVAAEVTAQQMELHAEATG